MAGLTDTMTKERLSLSIYISGGYSYLLRVTGTAATVNCHYLVAS